jgi:hypothetical protein
MQILDHGSSYWTPQICWSPIFLLPPPIYVAPYLATQILDPGFFSPLLGPPDLLASHFPLPPPIPIGPQLGYPNFGSWIFLPCSTPPTASTAWLRRSTADDMAWSAIDPSALAWRFPTTASALALIGPRPRRIVWRRCGRFPYLTPSDTAPFRERPSSSDCRKLAC